MDIINWDTTWLKIDRKGNPYPGYYFPREAKQMFELLMELPADALVVELGSLFGRSSIVIGEASRVRGFEFVCVDAFTLTGDDDIKNHLIENVINVYEGASLIADTTDNVAATWDRPIDYLFIDACHEEHGIMADCENWLPFVKKGGVAQFHDYFHEKEDESFPHLSVVVDSFTRGWELIGIRDSSCFKRR